MQFGQLAQIFTDGGPVMWPILLLSIVALVVIFERMLTFIKARVNVTDFLSRIRKALLVNRNVKEAVKVCEESPGPVSSVMKAGLLRYGHAREDVEKTIENAALYELDRLERGLGVLATVANIAPMLGFFGTVVGMIQSFDVLAAQSLSNPQAVAEGIKVALITTAAGLFVAIPVQLAYNFFSTKVNRFIRDIETASNLLLETYGEMDSARYGSGQQGSGAQA